MCRGQGRAEQWWTHTPSSQPPCHPVSSSAIQGPTDTHTPSVGQQPHGAGRAFRWQAARHYLTVPYVTYPLPLANRHTPDTPFVCACHSHIGVEGPCDVWFLPLHDVLEVGARRGCTHTQGKMRPRKWHMHMEAVQEAQTLKKLGVPHNPQDSRVPIQEFRRMC